MEALLIQEELSVKGTRIAISDIAVGVQFLRAALLGASMQALPPYFWGGHMPWRVVQMLWHLDPSAPITLPDYEKVYREAGGYRAHIPRIFSCQVLGFQPLMPIKFNLSIEDNNEFHLQTSRISTILYVEAG